MVPSGYGTPAMGPSTPRLMQLTPAEAAGQYPAQQLALMPSLLGSVAPSSSVTSQDWKNLLEKSRHDEMLAEGVARVKSVFTANQPDASSRFSVMSAKKVIEIEKMLIEELEGSVISKVGWLAGIFHTWRCESTIQRVGRRFEDEFDRHKGDWEKYLTDERQHAEELRIHAAKKAAERVAKNVRAAGFLLERWAFGDDKGLVANLVRCWRDFAQKQHVLGVQKQRVHTLVACWAVGGKLGSMHVCFQNWHQETLKVQVAKSQEVDLSKLGESWNEFLATESAKHRAQLDQALQNLESKKSRDHQDVEVILAKWERGERTGIAGIVVTAWREMAKSMSTVRLRSNSVRKAMMQFTEGESRGTMHICFKSWKALALHEGRMLGELQKIKNERTQWESYLENERKGHADALQAAMSEAELRKVRAHEATQLMLLQWQRGDESGLLATVVHGWRQVKNNVAAMNWQRQSVHSAVTRFIEGDTKGTLHCFFLNWKHWTKTEALYKAEVYERDRRISHLEERASALVGKSQSRLLKYARMLGTSDDPMLLIMVLAGWRVHASGLKSSDEQRKLAAELEEQRRLHDIAMTRKRHLLSSSFEFLGMKNRGVLVLETFLTWSQIFQEQRQQRLHALTHTKLVNKYAWYLQKMFSLQDSEAVVAACFWELLREAKQNKHNREREEREQYLQEIHMTRVSVEDELENLRAQLESAYRQIDSMAETLNKELKTKEELAAELREAYKELRQSNAAQAENRSASKTTITTTRITSSASAGMPHLPANALSKPGGTHPGLSRPLV